MQPASSGVAACQSLALCCGNLSSALQPECVQAVASNEATSCAAELAGFQTSGACGAPGSGTGISTGTTGAGCAGLVGCCAALGGTAAAACFSVVGQNVAATCNAELSAYEATGGCARTGTGTGTGTFTGTGTGTGMLTGTGTGTGTFTSTGTGTGSFTGTGTGTETGTHTGTSTGGPTCASTPSSIPAGFVPPTGIYGSGCTKAETLALGACEASPPTTDAGMSTCNAAIEAPDGALNTCGQCYDGTTVVPGQPIPAEWGFNVIAAIYGTLGDSSTLYGVNIGANFGGCVIGADPVAGKKCGLDGMAAVACELAVCLPLCAVPFADANNSGAFDAISACFNAADSGACSPYINAQSTDCKALIKDGGSDPVSKCESLYNIDQGLDGGTATAIQQADLLGLVCGGVDAGF